MADDETLGARIRRLREARVLGVSMNVLFHGEDEAARIAAERERPGTSRPSSCG
jgi:hypothetical protein